MLMPLLLILLLYNNALVKLRVLLEELPPSGRRWLRADLGRCLRGSIAYSI